MPMIRFFGVLIFLSQQVTCNKMICKEKSSLIIINDANMTSKRAFLKKNSFTNFNHQRMRFYLNKIVVYGVFLSQRSPRIMSSAKCK